MLHNKWIFSFSLISKAANQKSMTKQCHSIVSQMLIQLGLLNSLWFEGFAVELEHVLAEGVVLGRHDLQTLAAAGPAVRVVIVEVNGQVFLLHRVLKEKRIQVKLNCWDIKFYY